MPVLIPSVEERLVSIRKALTLVIASLSFDDDLVRQDLVPVAIDQIQAARSHAQSLLRSLSHDVLSLPSSADDKVAGLFKTHA